MNWSARGEQVNTADAAQGGSGALFQPALTHEYRAVSSFVSTHLCTCRAEILKSLLPPASLLSFALRLITQRGCCLQNNCANVFIFNKDIQRCCELKPCTFLCARTQISRVRASNICIAACVECGIVYTYTYKEKKTKEILGIHLQLL